MRLETQRHGSDRTTTRLAMEQAGYSVGWSLGRLGQRLHRTANTLRDDLMEITTEAGAITTKAGRQPARVREKTAVGTTYPCSGDSLANASQIAPHHHELSGRAKLDGDAARLAIGGMSLSALLIRRLFFPAFALPTGLGTGLGLAVTIATGYPFFRNGLRVLTRSSAASTDTLITTATIASLLLGETVTGLIVLSLLNVGELLQSLVLRRTRQAIQQLLSVGDEEAWVVLNGREVRVPLQQVQVGDVMAVYPGQKIPVDGVIERGQGTVNQAPITGESLSVFRNPGDTVYAGTLLEAGTMRVRAERVGSATAVGRLIQRVEAARELKASIETIGDAFSRRFVPFSFLMAGLVFLLTRDLRRSITMLLVACPCAAGLATPTAVSAAIGNGARRGILIKGGRALQAAGTVDCVLFDKTGTLTTGRPRVDRVISCDPALRPEVLLTLAASGELHSIHPLALAVVRHARDNELEIPEHEACEVIVGRGMRVDLHGNRILIGSQQLMADFGVVVPPQVVTEAQALRKHGQSVLYVGVNGRLRGLIGIVDMIRPEARQLLQSLQRAGIRRLVMLTGDSLEAAEIVAQELGVDAFHAGLLPEDKLRLVHELQHHGYQVAMVGDGINDSPALAAADLGIAMGTEGADVAIEAADVALASNELSGVVMVIDLSQHTLSVVKWNYALALGLNGLGIAVGALGALNPILAAVLHNLSTVAVVLNSSRLIGYQPLANGRRARARS